MTGDSLINLIRNMRGWWAYPFFVGRAVPSTVPSRSLTRPSFGVGVGPGCTRLARDERVGRNGVADGLVHLHALIPDQLHADLSRVGPRLEGAHRKLSRTTTKPKTENLTPQLEKAFRGLGLSESHATIAARGRGGRPVAAGSLTEAAAKELGLDSARAKLFARGRDLSEVVRNSAGLSAACFAYVADAEDPTTWQLQIARSDDSGKGWSPDEDLVRAAASSLPGIAAFGKEVGIPDMALPAVRSVLRSAWIACGANLDEMPGELQQEGLRIAFEGMGLSPAAAAAAAKGRAG
jgi:hypothetical protein